MMRARLAGIDLLTGTVHALVKDRHRSREFIEFLKILDTAYPAATAIKLILDNHSAHISRETKTWLAAQPDGRFAFVFTSEDEGFSRQGTFQIRFDIDKYRCEFGKSTMAKTSSTSQVVFDDDRHNLDEMTMELVRENDEQFVLDLIAGK